MKKKKKEMKHSKGTYQVKPKNQNFGRHDEYGTESRKYDAHGNEMDMTEFDKNMVNIVQSNIKRTGSDRASDLD